jgi:hypothetical protein
LFRSVEPDFGSGRTAMALYIAKSFLSDSKQAQGYVGREVTWNVFMREIDLNVLLFGKLSAQGTHTKN